VEDSYPAEVEGRPWRVTVRAVVTRRDGTVEDLGVISDSLVDPGAAEDEVR
jgi:hypothetical protein